MKEKHVLPRTPSFPPPVLFFFVNEFFLFQVPSLFSQDYYISPDWK
jgi:hypothetical protein